MFAGKGFSRLYHGRFVDLIELRPASLGASLALPVVPVLTGNPG